MSSNTEGKVLEFKRPDKAKSKTLSEISFEATQRFNEEVERRKRQQRAEDNAKLKRSLGLGKKK